MIPSLRQEFNDSWSEAKHARVVAELHRHIGSRPEFPISETPCFFPRTLMEELAETGVRLVTQLRNNPAAVAAADAVVPARYRGRDDGPHPTFLQVDFGLVRDEHGRIRPKLVELQAFASLYAMQVAMADAYREAFACPRLADAVPEGPRSPVVPRAGRARHRRRP